MKIRLVSNINLLIVLLISELFFFASLSKANPFILGCWRWISENETIVRINFKPDNTYTHKTTTTKNNGEPFAYGSSGTWQYDGVYLVTSDDKNDTKGIFVISSPNTLSTSYGNNSYNHTYYRC